MNKLFPASLIFNYKVICRNNSCAVLDICSRTKHHYTTLNDAGIDSISKLRTHTPGWYY